jgi:4-hydroxythreonine-4-phosphate dehydrogenase
MTRPHFIFMLTRGDVTIADARDRLPQVLAAGVRHIGFKDVGLPFAEMTALAEEIRAAGATLYLEMVSLDADAEAAGARAAVALGVDVLMGGARPAVVEPIIAGAPIRYFPFAGEIAGHPSRLMGDIEAIARSAGELCARPAVSGLDLLAYRADGDTPALIQAICRAAAGKPVIVAGSIDREARIAAVARGRAAAFTVGTAALDAVFPAPPDLERQLAHVRMVVERLGLDREAVAPHGSSRDA